MADDTQDRGSFGGTLEGGGPNPDPHPFGFDPSFTPDLRPVRDRIQDNPALSLSFNIASAKAAKNAQGIDVGLHTDSAVLPMILDTEAKRRQQQQDLESQINAFEEKMKTPPPARPQPQPTAGTAIAGALTALFGGNISRSLGIANEAEAQRADTDYQNKLQAYGVTHEQYQAILGDLMRQHQQGQTALDDMANARISELTRQENLAVSEADKAADRKVREDAEARQEHHQIAAEIADRYKAVEWQLQQYGGAQSEQQAAELQQTVDELNAEAKAAGIPGEYPPVRGGPTEKAQNDKRAADFKQTHLDAEVKKWETDANIKDKEVAAKLADWSLRRNYEMGMLAVAQDRVGIDRIRALDSGALQKAKLDVEKVDAELSSVQARLQDPKTTRADKKKLYGQQSSLLTKQAAAKRALVVIEGQSAQDGGTGQPPTGSVPPPDNELLMAQEAIGRHPNAAAKIKAAYTQRTGKPWPGG